MTLKMNKYDLFCIIWKQETWTVLTIQNFFYMHKVFGKAFYFYKNFHSQTLFIVIKILYFISSLVTSYIKIVIFYSNIFFLIPKYTSIFEVLVGYHNTNREFIEVKVIMTNWLETTPWWWKVHNLFLCSGIYSDFNI